MRLWLLVLFCCLAHACGLGAGELFHLAWTSDAASFAPWRTAGLRSIERHYAGQPLLLRLYTNSLSAADLGPFASLHVHVTPIDDALFAGTPLVEWWAQAAATIARRGLNLSDTKDYLYSHLTDAIRYAALWKHGGVYVDFDVILLRPLTVFTNSLGIQTLKNGKGQMEANFAVAKFDKGNKFLLDAMKHFAEKYDPACWTCVGPSLVTFLLHRWSAAGCVTWKGKELPEVVLESHPCRVYVFPPEVFYPIPYQVSFVRRRDSAAADLARLHAHAATVHVWTSVIKRQSEKEYKLAPGVKPHTEPGSILDLMLTELGMEGERFRDRV